MWYMLNKFATVDFFFFHCSLEMSVILFRGYWIIYRLCSTYSLHLHRIKEKGQAKYLKYDQRKWIVENVYYLQWHIAIVVDIWSERDFF